jgi:hypothetical protein
MTAGARRRRTAVLEVLSGQVAYTIEADRLTITNGQSGLTLEAAR